MANISSLTKGLVAHYPLDGIHGTKDVTPNGNHGVNYGAVLSTGRKGEAEGAYSFDGVGYGIELVNNSLFEFTADCSISCWIKHTAITDQIYICKWSGYNSGSDWWLGYYQEKMRVGFYADQSLILSSNIDVADGEWHLVTANRNGSTISIYIDGTPIQSGISTGAIGVNSQPVRVGDVVGIWSFDGSISDVRIYNRALSEDEISLLYNSFKPQLSISSLQKGLVGHWPLDKEHGAKDVTPYGNHGTAYGGVVAGGATDRKGRVGGATEFDGVDDYILTEKVVNEVNPDSFTMYIKFYTQGFVSYYDGIYTIKGSGDSIDSGGITFDITSSTSVRIRHWNDGGTNYVITVSNLLNNWHEAAIVVNNKNIKVYIDKELKVDESFVGDFVINDGRISFGLYYAPTAEYFNGSISDARFYNRALSPQEVKLLYDSYRPSAAVGSLSKGLVLDMPLTSKYVSNGLIKDVTPYANHGTNYGAVIGEDGATFDNASDVIEIVDNDSLDALEMSAFLCVKWFGSSGRIAECFLEKRTNSPYSGYFFFIYNGNNIYIDIYNHATIQNRLVMPYILGINISTYIGYTFFNNYLRFYVNGELIYTSEYIVGHILPSPANLFIGNGNAISTAYGFNGSISDVKIYNRALSDDEVKLLYDKGRS